MPNHYTEQLMVDGYDLEIAQTLESRNKGRILAYIMKGARLQRQLQKESEFDDMIVVENEKIRVVGIYSGFQTYGSETMIGNYERLICSLEKISRGNKLIIITGDFNTHLTGRDPKSRILNLWCAESGLTQLVNETTRTRVVDGTVQRSSLDLVFTNDCDRLKTDVLPAEVSDHDVIKISTNRELKGETINVKKVIMDWRHFNDEEFNRSLEKNCKDITFSDNVNILNRELICALTLSMNELLPLRVVHLRKHTDIDSVQIESLKKKRDRWLKKAKKSGDVEKFKRVKELNAEIKRVVKKEKKRVINLKINDSSPKGFWNTVNGLLGRNCKDAQFPIVENGQLIPDDQLADKFSEFFLTKVNNFIHRSALLDPPVQPGTQRLEPITCEEIRKAFSTFKPKKSTGPDDIPMLVLKCSQEVLMRHLSSLFNLIIAQCKIPEAWKTARLKPIFKKGDRGVISNYRPISNLNSISKVFERCLLNRIPADIDGKNQHGFRASHSTITAGLEIQSTLANLLDHKKPCIIYSTDLSAAFDLIRPGIFHQKAKRVIGEPMADMIHEFITERKGYVEVEGERSYVFNFPAGCPQGSTLGPRVFNIYCCDLNSVIESDCSTITTYADDSYVVVWSKTDTDEELKANLVATMTRHVEWLKDSGMVCNIDKTEMMTLGTGSMEITLDGNVIRSKPQIKVLGIVFDSNLDWSAQVAATIGKAARTLHGLRFIRKHLDFRQAKQVITSYFFSVLYYGIEIWYHPHLAFDLKRRVRAAHYRAMRLVYGTMKSRAELNLLRATPDEMALFNCAKLLTNVCNTGLPNRLATQLDENCFYERRYPWRLQFFDSSIRKIGKQCFKNRLSQVARMLKFDWLILSRTEICNRIKSCILPHLYPDHQR